MRRALALAALFAAPAAAAPLALPFAPPLDTPLRYRSVEYRPGGDRGTQSFAITLSLRFARAGDGYVLRIVNTAIAAHADPAARRLFEAGMRPFVGVPTRVRLGADGCPTGVIDADATWARIAAAFASLSRAARTSGRPELAAEMKRYFDVGFAGSRALREARLLGGAYQFLCFSRAPLEPGASRAWRDESASAFGQPTAGTIALADADDRRAHLVIAAASDGAATAAAAGAMAAKLGQAATPAARAALDRRLAAIRATRLTQRRDIRVARDTGLLISSERIDRSEGPAGTRPLARATVRRLL